MISLVAPSGAGSYGDTAEEHVDDRPRKAQQATVPVPLSCNRRLFTRRARALISYSDWRTLPLDHDVLVEVGDVSG
jgi:hypothetical protein